MALLSSIIAQNLEDTPSKLVNLQLFLDSIHSGLGLGGTNYVFVRGNGTPAENATELQEAYNAAKTMPRHLGLLTNETSGHFYPGQTFALQPSGVYYYKVTEEFEGTISSSIAYYIQITEEEAKATKTTLVVAPGKYIFGSSFFEANATSVNIVSLTGNSDVYIDGITVSADYVHLKGIDCKTYAFGVIDNLSNLVCENCIGLGDYSFGGDGGVVPGTFINCKAKNNSFGGGGTASGTFVNCEAEEGSFGGSNGGTASGNFINCIGGIYSFGGSGYASGTFLDCKGGNYSFGGGLSNGTANGTFTNCIGGIGSFGGPGSQGIAMGVFKNCKGGEKSFSGGGTASGTFTNCEGGNYSFGGDAGVASGTFRGCTGMDSSFGGLGGTASGTFNNCVGGAESFGGASGITSGTFTDCVSGDGSFGSVASGTFTNCIGGTESFGSYGAASGTFTNCTGGVYSFGAGYGGEAISSTGRLYYCRTTSGSFPDPVAGGKLVLCVDGTDAIVTTA